MLSADWSEESAGSGLEREPVKGEMVIEKTMSASGLFSAELCAWLLLGGSAMTVVVKSREVSIEKRIKMEKIDNGDDNGAEMTSVVFALILV